MRWIRTKLSIAWSIINSLKIEPFVLIFVMSANVSEIARVQLIQDKICLNNYNQSRDFCIDLSKIRDTNDDPDYSDETKNKILADVAKLSTYIQIISTLPAFFYILFIGPFLDRYINGRRVVLCLGMCGYAGWYSLQLLNAIKFEWSKQANRKVIGT